MTTVSPRQQQQQAEVLHRLHHGDRGPLVLVNAWDAASARLLERAGAGVIATTSAGTVSYTHLTLPTKRIV